MDGNSMDEGLVASLERLGISGAYELVKRHLDEAPESLESGPVTEALIETLLHMTTLWRQGPPVKEALEHVVLSSLSLGYRIGVEQTEADRAVEGIRQAK